MNFYELMVNVKRPRVYKTHLPIQLLPPQIWTKNVKFIFIHRDVKDVAVSNYYFRQKCLGENVGSKNDHYYDFMNNRVNFGPYKTYLKNFFSLRGKPNVLFLTYEEVTSDLKAAIRKVAKFLGKEASDENVKELADRLNFKNMKGRVKTPKMVNI